MRRSHVRRLALLAQVWAAAACYNAPADLGGPSLAKAPSGPVVTSTAPDFAGRDTTLDVRVLGSGFDDGSVVAFLLGGAADPGVVTHSTRFVSSSELVANITVAANAVTDYRDVAVTTAIGKKGIGTAKFQVVEPLILQIQGATSGLAWDVNSNGQVTGNYSVAGSTCTQRGYVWSEAAGVITLPIPAGYCQSKGRGINDAGLVSGTIWPTGGAIGTTGVAVRWVPTGPSTWNVEILPKPQPESVLLENLRISDNGSVTALWTTGGVTESWLWQAGTGWLRLAPLPGGGGCSPWDINAVGVVAGGSCVWTSPSLPPVGLPLLGGASSANAGGLNNAGVVVGGLTYATRNTSAVRLTRWIQSSPGVWVAEDLGVSGGGNDVNDDGVIVGTAFGMWTPTVGATPLVSLKGQAVAMVRAVSNRGPSGITWIVGYGPIGPSSPNYPIIWKR